jgi:hypothetical protein
MKGGQKMDYSKLRGRIVEKYGTVSEFSKHLSISRVSLDSKLHGKIRISREDVIEWCKLLEIQQDEIGAYFFTEKVDSCN